MNVLCNQNNILQRFDDESTILLVKHRSAPASLNYCIIKIAQLLFSFIRRRDESWT